MVKSINIRSIAMADIMTSTDLLAIDFSKNKVRTHYFSATKLKENSLLVGVDLSSKVEQVCFKVNDTVYNVQLKPKEFEEFLKDKKDQGYNRSEEHTSELQSPDHLVCRLLLEKKKTKLSSTTVLQNSIAHDGHVRAQAYVAISTLVSIVVRLFLSVTRSPPLRFFFFFNDTATTEIYTLSLHDALPIWRYRTRRPDTQTQWPAATRRHRSEEHTSELQSPDHLVCRLLLEKKKKEKKKATRRSREGSTEGGCSVRNER